ncbi:conserved exported hypothetical protein [Acidobacteriia bacterium SbA2]|nr:conserved exported hypothetical protein [Acidobacteriia bacterium SbA2]
MWTRTMAVSILGLYVGCGTLQGQQKPAAASPSGVLEFPVVMQQSVNAGKTPVGTKVQARLEFATLVDGNVIPRNAVFSGEVIESTAKAKTEPSRLAIRMDSVQWKSGSASVKVYLTAWYYPAIDEMGQDLQYGPQQGAKRTWNGQGQYPDTTTKVYKPFPGSESDKGSVPDTPASATSNHRVLMKDVEATSASDGSLALVSKHANLKLDKLTTYVLASGDVLPTK